MSKNNEGITVANNKDGLDVTIVREDHTTINFFDSVHDLVKSLVRDDLLFIIDNKVLELYKDVLEPIVKNSPVFAIDVTEKEKSWENLAAILEDATKHKISRKGAIVAIGGGVITDMAGLASNLYFRGIRSILVPTSLLAMVDAAIGGKVAVNHPYQKNMIGSFYHPTEVLVAPEFLQTAEKRHVYSAAGEIVKLAILSDTELFSLVENAPKNWEQDQEFLQKVVRLCIHEKLTMLGANCFERDLKRPLNLGHSVAHPLEDITDFAIFHGEAVAYGLLIASNISLQRGLLSKQDFERIYKAARDFGCTVHATNFDKELLWERIRRLIAQRGGTGLLYVLPTTIGDATIVKDITKDELFNAIEALAKLTKAI